MSVSSPLEPWSTVAVNLPEHADNPIHTDAGARAAGFERAIVAGTSVYAYLTHPPAASWGADWVGGGGAEVRFVAPVFDQDVVDCVIGGSPQAPVVEARVGGAVRATYAVEPVATPPVDRDGEELPPFEVALDEQRAGYGRRCGDDLALYDELGIVHPVAWPALANQVFMRNLVDGPWIHTRSRVVHLGLAPVGGRASVSARVVDRFETRAGERALVDVHIDANGEPAAWIEHEAIIRLTP